MKPTELLSAQLIDILFSDRNKLYGAYELRKTYSKRISAALFITMFIAAAGFGGATIASGAKEKKPLYKQRTVVDLTPIPKDKPKEPLPEAQPKQKPEPVQSRILTAPTILPDPEVEHPAPDKAALDTVMIGDKDIFTGKPYGGVVVDPDPPGKEKGIIEAPVTEPAETIVAHVEVEAKFVGDWVRFLLKNLNADVPSNNNAGPGRYSVIIQFVVDKEGNVSDINALTKHGYGMEEEAIRVIKKAPRWEPAIQNGYKVKAYRKQVITFDVLE